MIKKFTAEERQAIMRELLQSDGCVFDKKTLVAGSVDKVHAVLSNMYGTKYNGSKSEIKNAICLLADYASGNMLATDYRVKRERTVNIDPFRYKSALDKIVEVVTDIANGTSCEIAERTDNA